MILINIGIFLLIAAIFIAVYKPTSTSDKWIFGIVVPLVLFFLELVIGRFYYGKEVSFTYLLASTMGESIVSVILSFITLFVCLKKKHAKGEQYKIPKWLIIAIVVVFALGIFSLWGNYRGSKALAEKETKEITSQAAETTKESSDNKEYNPEAADAKKLLPELITFIKQGLPSSRDGMSWTDIEIRENVLALFYTIDGNRMNFNEVTTSIASNPIEFFEDFNSSNNQIAQAVISAGYDFSVEFKDNNSGKTKWITVSADELKKYAK